MAGAIFGTVAVSLFVAGAIFGDVGLSLFVAGAIFGDVGLSLFVAGAAFGETWVDSSSAKNLQFSIRNASPKREILTSANGRVQDDELIVGSCSDHGRIVRHCKRRFNFSAKFLLDFGMQFCAAGAEFGEVGGLCLLLRAL